MSHENLQEQGADDNVEPKPSYTNKTMAALHAAFPNSETEEGPDLDDGEDQQTAPQ